MDEDRVPDRRGRGRGIIPDRSRGPPWHSGA
jgi:hypothetical protein